MATKQKDLVIKNRTQANSIARFYIDDDRYIMMAPQRMTHIAGVLMNDVDECLTLPLRKIIEVCSHQDTSNDTITLS